MCSFQHCSHILVGTGSLLHWHTHPCLQNVNTWTFTLVFDRGDTLSVYSYMTLTPGLFVIKQDDHWEPFFCMFLIASINISCCIAKTSGKNVYAV